ncbi:MULTISPECIES: TrkH family potassium uptake protein [unclassified Breznakia]|uniref:TrkH family potassium uptake protein n=1 Tax=unclassified Breznakia TaxID=2623764 RepID=UPI0024762CF7|nr:MULTISPECIES: TrkH family potassium uptake protein [unclassified Breznakia]MDH6366437.1 trk system potassium uptake protein TrkH [Breznakia sp. PH1-1]MDH6403530.1 trk system potassium uptake protein TrkH [Breznakia sp. PF1-11]MDH6411239.1 trk system potassium uptake protein TrkH [Breznakia sp. PFB1-11]MDH6413498.1 trk system potassium uptake protein TrkH [Breznakia sp. PFB1-14]MDH6415784.1 trk system potassium uptake protein TrkH [Breznakia sp. PFB1-4]
MKHKLYKIVTMSGLSPTKKIAISFFAVIFIGACLLTLPIANQPGTSITFIDALFTATSAVCVTGLVVYFPAVQLTLFGQVVLMLLIQIGGLGLMTLVATIHLGLKNRLSVQNKIAMREALGQKQVVDYKAYLFRIVKYTFSFELVGALLLAFVFVPEQGIARGLFWSIFTAISAFCNAGFDLVGTVNLAPYVSQPLVNLVVMGLIISGGLGFIVYFDVRDKMYLLTKQHIPFKQFIKRLNLQTKLVFIMTIILIFVPALFIFINEYNNPNTLGALSLDGKIFASLFNSVTLRTAGFSTIDYTKIYEPTAFMMIVTMFIGGSPGGTAGGIKTTTFAVIAIFVIHSLRGHTKTSVFHRTLSLQTVASALNVFTLNFLFLFTGIMILSSATDFSLLAIMFEAVSAMATVGLSLGITASLPILGKLIIITLMYVGRIGIITFLSSIIREDKHKDIEYAEGRLMIG